MALKSLRSNGAELIANRVEPEPLIVPIAIANFDKKITHTKTVALIQKPFKLSEFVPPGSKDSVLFDFIHSFKST